jgi:hypothetical protein
MKARQETEGQAGPLDIHVEYSNEKGAIKNKSFSYAGGKDRDELKKTVDSIKDERYGGKANEEE